jgi:hypothetical protein
MQKGTTNIAFRQMRSSSLGYFKLPKTPDPRSLNTINHEVFYSAQYEPVLPVQKESYRIEKNIYVRIRQLILILYYQFFSCSMGDIHR